MALINYKITNYGLHEYTQTGTALPVLDLVESTQFICNSGDTVFSSVIGRIYHHFKAHACSSDLLFLKCTGDGLLAAYSRVTSAMAIAATFLNTGILAENPFRMALHWGNVKTGPEGDPLGAEAHRVFRMESVSAAGKMKTLKAAGPFPEYDRLLTSKQALEQMDASTRNMFSYAGRFHLKGFPDPCDLWVAVKKEA